MLSVNKTESIVIHTGNIVNWNHLKRKVTQTATEELEECLRKTLEECHESDNNFHHAEHDERTLYVNSQSAVKILPEERDTLKLIVKVNLCDFHHEELIPEAVERVTHSLNTAFIETLIIDFPEKNGSNDLSLEDMKPYWKMCEDLVSKGKVLTLGVSDLSQPLLESLCNWAKVKPCINQVNLATCCVMPEDLVHYAKENSIQLLTHNDPKVLLPEKVIQDIMSTYCDADQATKWTPVWSLRYTVTIKCRGIINNKGFIAKVTQSMK